MPIWAFAIFYCFRSRAVFQILLQPLRSLELQGIAVIVSSEPPTSRSCFFRWPVQMRMSVCFHAIFRGPNHRELQTSDLSGWGTPCCLQFDFGCRNSSPSSEFLFFVAVNPCPNFVQIRPCWKVVFQVEPFDDLRWLMRLPCHGCCVHRASELLSLMV